MRWNWVDWLVIIAMTIFCIVLVVIFTLSYVKEVRAGQMMADMFFYMSRSGGGIGPPSGFIHFSGDPLIFSPGDYLLF